MVFAISFQPLNLKTKVLANNLGLLLFDAANALSSVAGNHLWLRNVGVNEGTIDAILIGAGLLGPSVEPHCALATDWVGAGDVCE